MSQIQIAFLPAMRLRGMVIAEFDQAQTAEFQAFPSGFCAGLTLSWLSMRVRRQNWPARQADAQTVINATTSASIYRSFTKFHDGIGKPSSPEAISTLARGVTRAVGVKLMEAFPTVQTRNAIDSVAGGLKLEIDPAFAPREWADGTAGHTFLHELAVLGSGLFYLSITAHINGRPDGGHAIGLHVFGTNLDSDCDLFDPNVGQLHFDQPNDIKWASFDLLRHYVTAEGITFFKGVAFRLREKMF